MQHLSWGPQHHCSTQFPCWGQSLTAHASARLPQQQPKSTKITTNTAALHCDPKVG